MKKYLVMALALALLPAMACSSEKSPKPSKENNSSEQKTNEEEKNKEQKETEPPKELTCPGKDFYGCAIDGDGKSVILECKGTKVTKVTQCTSGRICASIDYYITQFPMCIFDFGDDGFCADKNDGEFCTEKNGDSWVVSCYDGLIDNTYTANCTAQKGQNCHKMEYQGNVYSFCKCTSNDQCETDIENALPICSKAGYCDFECAEGFEKVGDQNSGYSCEKIKFTDKTFCNGKEAGYYCTTVDDESWSVACQNDEILKQYTKNCTEQNNQTCGPVVQNGRTYNICKCSSDDQCSTTVQNAKGVCSQSGTCAWDCKEGYIVKVNLQQQEYYCTTPPDAFTDICNGKQDGEDLCYTDPKTTHQWIVTCYQNKVFPDPTYTADCSDYSLVCGEAQSLQGIHHDCVTCNTDSDCQAKGSLIDGHYECIANRCEPRCAIPNAVISNGACKVDCQQSSDCHDAITDGHFECEFYKCIAHCDDPNADFVNGICTITTPQACEQASDCQGTVKLGTWACQDKTCQPKCVENAEPVNGRCKCQGGTAEEDNACVIPSATLSHRSDFSFCVNNNDEQAVQYVTLYKDNVDQMTLEAVGRVELSASASTSYAIENEPQKAIVIRADEKRSYVKVSKMTKGLKKVKFDVFWWVKVNNGQLPDTELAIIPDSGTAKTITLSEADRPGRNKVVTFDDAQKATSFTITVGPDKNSNKRIVIDNLVWEDANE